MGLISPHKLLVMVIALIAITMVVQTASAQEVNTVRLYGEDGLATPNFPYESAEGPLDPLSCEAPYTDFMTFNPAIFEKGIVVNQANAYEKVFVRQYFVPDYKEPAGKVWLKLDKDEYVKSDDIVTEFTYMFVDKVNYQPIEGTACDPKTGAYWTKFWFPIADRSDEQFGLDSLDANGDGKDDMVHLEKVSGFYDTRYNDFGLKGSKEIRIATDSFQVSRTGSANPIQFMDHMVVIKDVAVSGSNPLITVTMDVYYTGNTQPELIEANYQASVVPGDYLVASRHTVADDKPSFYYPWFLRADAVSQNYVYITVGRTLCEGETFFVDGAEYDVAAIYGSVSDGFPRAAEAANMTDDVESASIIKRDCTVKYITLRNPVPENGDLDLGRLSIIKERIYAGDIIPMLPPFNREHVIIDDIDVPIECDEWDNDHRYEKSKFKNPLYTSYYRDLSNPGDRKLAVDAMEIYFVDEDIERRFNTSLLEILDEECCIVPTSGVINDKWEEKWQRLEIFTKPYQYKDFVYPEVADIENSSADFLLTSSFEAPAHVDFYRNFDLIEEMDGSKYKKANRLMLEYDQERGFEDIYINEIDEETNGLRLYGGAYIDDLDFFKYKDEEFVADLLDAKFPYSADNPEGPFDPLNKEAPEMDFVTLNPAVINDNKIYVEMADAYEKVFIRQWFDADYHEPAGDVWLDCYSHDFQRVSDDVVTEYSYMLVNKEYQPIESTALDPETCEPWTRFWFPIADNDDEQIGLDGYDINGDGIDDMVYLRAVRDFNCDGRTDIAISSGSFQLQTGEQDANGNSVIQFIDHKVVVKDVVLAGFNSNPLISLTMDIYYTGNDEPELIAENYQASIVPGGAAWAGRHVVTFNNPGFDYPWFITADAASENNVYVTVGRLLHTGESFFVDGAEYDVAMIYGSCFEQDGNDGEPMPIGADNTFLAVKDQNSVRKNTFKYITIRNPLPEEEAVDLGDLSIIKEPIQPLETIPVLPPFNTQHKVIDDTDVWLFKNETKCYDGHDRDFESEYGCSWCYDEKTCYYEDCTDVANRISPLQAPLDIYYTNPPEVEDRFSSNMFEILCEGTVLFSEDSRIPPSWGNKESWKWLNIRTLPDLYKEFVYPCAWDYRGAGDYIVTSSFTAPLSEICRDNYNVNDIDGMDGSKYFCKDQRLMFSYIPQYGTGLYMNQVEVNGNGDNGDNGEVETMLGDFNGDEICDFKDLSAFALAYNTSEGDSEYDPCGDFNGDKVIDFKDLSAFALVYNK